MKTLRFISYSLWLAAVMVIVPFSCGAIIAKADHISKYRIAIIDSGYDDTLISDGAPKLKLCKYGHFDFVSGENKIASGNPHGTAVAAIIAKKLENVDYCAVIYNVYSRVLARIPQAKLPTDSTNLWSENLTAAFYKASYENLDAVNASYSGNLMSVAEREALKDAAKRIPKIFVAAGNAKLNLDQSCLAFPTCFDIDNVISVGALDDKGRRANDSNYGSKVKEWFSGNGSPKFVSGSTSFASPRALSAYILSLEQREPTTIKKQSAKRH